MNAVIGQFIQRDLGTKNDSYWKLWLYLLFLLPHKFSRQTTMCNFLIHSFNTFSFFAKEKLVFFLASLQICFSGSLIQAKTIYVLCTLIQIFCKQKTSRQVLGRSIDSDTAVRNNIQGKLMYLPKYNMHSVTQ